MLSQQKCLTFVAYPFSPLLPCLLLVSLPPLPYDPRQPALLQRVGGLMVDLKLLQVDCLEALADNLREQAAAAAAAGGAAAAAAVGKKRPPKGKQQQPAAAAVEPEEVAVLLQEADRLAGELIDDD